MNKLYTLNDAWVAWCNNEKFPIAFYGDSTIDGNTTTGHIRNQLGVDSVSPNTFSRKLEDKLKAATGNKSLRIYNAGFSGMVAGWGLENFEKAFGKNSCYNDVKMIGIGFGINDRLAPKSIKEYKENFKRNVKGIIDLCFKKGIQPFLLTTQAIVEPGVTTVFVSQYPLRTTVLVNTIANEVKRELAREIGLELLDINKYTENFLLYSSYSLTSIIPDRLHFCDVGHEYESQLLFSLLNPQTIPIDGDFKLDYSGQKVAVSVPDDWLSFMKQPDDPFKVVVNLNKDDTKDMNIFRIYIFNKGKRQLNLRAYKSCNNSNTYVKINGEKKSLTGNITDLGLLDLGLYMLDVYTGNSKMVDFKGFILE